MILILRIFQLLIATGVQNQQFCSFLLLGVRILKKFYRSLLRLPKYDRIHGASTSTQSNVQLCMWLQTMENERVDFLMVNVDTRKDEFKAFGFETVPKIQLFVFPDDYRKSIRELAGIIHLSKRYLFHNASTQISSVRLIRWVRTQLFKSSILQVCT